MTAYATRFDIETSYGVQYLQTLVAADLDLDLAVERACLAASAEIDLYVSQRYSLPLNIVPEIIKTWTVDLACWKLAPNSAQNSTETTKRAERVLMMLRDIAAGKSRIPELDPQPPSSGGAVSGLSPDETSEYAPGGAVFNSDRRRYGNGGGL